MNPSSQSVLSLDDHLNESSTDDEQANTHRQAECDSFTKRLRQLDNEQTKNIFKSKYVSQKSDHSRLPLKKSCIQSHIPHYRISTGKNDDAAKTREQSKWEDELTNTTTPHFGLVDNEIKNCKRQYDYIFDTEKFSRYFDDAPFSCILPVVDFRLIFIIQKYYLNRITSRQLFVLFYRYM
jgi:hypothetical protein